jgi:hypothetical protein
MKLRITLIALISAPLAFPQLPLPSILSPFQSLNGIGRVRGINIANTVVGNTVGGDGNAGFVLQNGTLTKIAIPNSIQTFIYGLENNDRIVGAYTKDYNGRHGFLYFHGDVTAIDCANASSTTAHGINDSHRVVGECTDANQITHGFIWDKDQPTQFDVFNSTATVAEDLNNRGDIVGHYTDASDPNNIRQRGFLRDQNGTVTQIDFPGAIETLPYGINSSGTIVGSYRDDNGTHGFVDVNGVFTGFDAPGTPPSVGTFAHSISNNGQIVVFGSTAFITSLQ